MRSIRSEVLVEGVSKLLTVASQSPEMRPAHREEHSLVSDLRRELLAYEGKPTKVRVALIKRKIVSIRALLCAPREVRQLADQAMKAIESSLHFVN